MEHAKILLAIADKWIEKTSEEVNPIPKDENPIEEAPSRAEYVNEVAQSEVVVNERLNSTSNDRINEEEKKDHATHDKKESSDIANTKPREPIRTVSNPQNNTPAMEKSEEDIELSEKKLMSVDESENSPTQSVSKNISSSNLGSPVKRRLISKKSDSELQCPECEYRSHGVGAWLMHLRTKHSTTPRLSGLVLRCECGYECTSNKHSRLGECEMGNFTVVRVRDGPIGRLHDEKTTPQCILCKSYPSTGYGYMIHLENQHRSTLKRSGIYLKCACGVEIASNCNKIHKVHNKTCVGKQYTLHRLDEK